MKHYYNYKSNLQACVKAKSSLQLSTLIDATGGQSSAVHPSSNISQQARIYPGGVHVHPLLAMQV